MPNPTTPHPNMYDLDGPDAGHEPRVHHYLELSARHIPGGIDALRATEGLVVYPYGGPDHEGAFLVVPPDPGEYAEWFEMDQRIVRVLRWAEIHGCAIVRFDSEVEVDESLPVFPAAVSS